jgi:hypothetical protein
MALLLGLHRACLGRDPLPSRLQLPNAWFKYLLSYLDLPEMYNFISLDPNSSLALRGTDGSSVFLWIYSLKTAALNEWKQVKTLFFSKVNIFAQPNPIRLPTQVWTRVHT